jgi:beta-lactam-binding protein with PASTA domain
MTHSLKPFSFILIAIVFSLLACSSPKMLFTVADGKQIEEDSRQVLIEREKESLPAKQDLKLKEGDRIQIAEGVDGTGLRTFHTVSTIHGPATLVLKKEYLEQLGGTAIHDAKEGKLLIPDMTIDHAGAVYLVVIEEETIDLIVFDGQITVSSSNAKPPWKPFFVNSGQRRKIWRDGRLAPNQPLVPDAMNSWIDSENQLLKAGGSSTRMVPSVVTLPSEDAKGLIASAEFPVNLKYLKEGEGELGTITKQEPGPGRRVDAKQTVAIYERSRPVIVPNVFGLSLGAAIDSLQRVGLNGQEVDRTITESVPPHQVNKQSPPAGELIGEGASIALTVEAVAVEVPNIVGQTVQDAIVTLGELQLKTGSTNYLLDHSGRPKVVSQTPLAGTKVLPESEIVVVLQALGFEVPNVVGQTAAEATQNLLGEGYQLKKNKEDFSDTVSKGRVISQAPRAGTVSGKDVKIQLTISKGKKN